MMGNPQSWPFAWRPCRLCSIGEGGGAGKRGRRGDLSHDAVAWYRGPGAPVDGSADVAIIDIIIGHCGSDPRPGWIDQTRVTAAAGSRGGWQARRILPDRPAGR